PKVVGKSLARATTALEKAGFVLGAKKERFDVGSSAGTVIEQNPASGEAPKGSPVDLVVSKGPPPTPVPDVTGRTQEAATAQLHGAGLTVDVQTAFSDSVAKGRVIGTTPSAGATAPYGSPITLTVSQGPQQFPCPNFVGLTVDDAKSLARSYGLQLTALAVP